MKPAIEGFVAIDAETSSLNAASAGLVGVALATAPGKACYQSHAASPVQVAYVKTQKNLDFLSEPATVSEQDQSAQSDRYRCCARKSERVVCRPVRFENWA